MQKEGSDNDSQAGEELKENEQPAKRMRHDDQVWDSSEMFLVETPVSFKRTVYGRLYMNFFPLEQNPGFGLGSDFFTTEHNARSIGRFRTVLE
jgi:hypothetical protein